MRHAPHPGDVDGVPLAGAEEGERRAAVAVLVGQVRGDGDLDERAAGGPVVHREPRDEATRRRRATSAWRRVHEPVPASWREDGLGVDARRALGRPLVRGEEAGDLGRVGARPARRAVSPAGSPSIVRSASLTRTTLAPPAPLDLHACTTAKRPRSTMGDEDDTGQPSQETLTRNWDELLQEIRVTQTGVQILTGFLLTVPVLEPLRRAHRRSSAPSTSRPRRVGAHDRARRRAGRLPPGALPAAPSRAARRVGQPVRAWPGWRCSRSRSRASCCSSSTSSSARPQAWVTGGRSSLVFTLLWAVLPRVADQRRRHAAQPATVGRGRARRLSGVAGAGVAQRRTR